jgi:predicted Zn-dependent protease
MKRAVLPIAALCLAATAALAAGNPMTDAAISTFQSVAQDPAKMKLYCEMSAVMDKAGDNPDEAAEAKIDTYVQKLGPDFQSAWDVGDNVDENSPDGERLDAALDQLTNKCPG